MYFWMYTVTSTLVSKAFWKIPNLLLGKPRAYSKVRLALDCWPLNMVFAKSSSRLGKGLIKFGFRGRGSSSMKYSGILTFVPGIFLIGGNLKNFQNFLKHYYRFHVNELLHQSVWNSSLHQPRLTSSLRSFVIKKQSSGVWWAIDAAVIPVYASYTIRNVTNVDELIRISQPFYRRRDSHIYWLHYFPSSFAGFSYIAFYRILSNS